MNPSTNKAQILLGPCQSCLFIRAQTYNIHSKDIPKKLRNDQQLNVDYTFRPDWVNESLYPFKSRYIELAESQVHYIDEGSGPVLLFLYVNSIPHQRPSSLIVFIDYIIQILTFTNQFISIM